MQQMRKIRILIADDHTLVRDGIRTLLELVADIEVVGEATNGKEALQKVAQIVTYAMLANIFFLLVEFFTVFYSRIPEHMNHFIYLLFGLEGRATLVPWVWASFILAVLALVLLINPNTRRQENILAVACAAVFASIWIDKGLGLIVPGFIPSTTGEIFEYWPTVPEALITLGVWALGFLILTILYKVAVFVAEETSA